MKKMNEIWQANDTAQGHYHTNCPLCKGHLYLKKTGSYGQKPDEYGLLPCSFSGCISEANQQSRCPPPAPPSLLAGRTVDGWGWKVFRKDENGLHSEAVGRTHDRSQTLPENTWLDYWDWKEIGSSGRLCWHVLETEEDAKNWVGQGKVGRQELVVRKIAWSGLSNRNPDYIFPPQFIGHIFTAEEIYILPEEGMPICLPAEPASGGPERGDWIHCGTVDHLDKVLGVDTKNKTVQVYCPQHDLKYTFRTGSCRIVRRAADPLRERDKVSFGSKEGEVTIVSEMAQTCRVKFDKTDVGWFNRKDLTLVQPVYDRPGEKGDC